MSLRVRPLWRRLALSAGAAALAFVATLTTPSLCSAQLIVGVDDPVEGIWNMNPSTNSVQTFLPGFAGTNLATDEVNKVLYFMTNTVQLWKWDYSAPGNTPSFIASLTSATSGTGFISINGLAYSSATGKLYGSRSLDSSAGPEGFYEIDPTTGFATNKIATGSTTFDWGGLDRDATTGKFYANGDPGVSGTSTPGIFEVNFTTNTFTPIAAYPAGATDMDGLAAGNGKIYMIEDVAVQAGGKIHVYNTITGQYESPLMVPWFFTETFSGGTFSPTLAEALANVPEPTSAGVLTLGATALLARRRRQQKVRRAAVLAAGALAVASVCTNDASAQLVMATDGLNEGMYATDLASVRPTTEFPLPANIATWQQIFAGRSIRGMAADEPNRMLYWLDLAAPFGGLPQSTLYRMSYDTLSPELVGVVRNSASGFEQGFQGLAIDTANRKMYGTYNIGGTPGEGIYEITNWEAPSGNTVFSEPRLLYNTLPGGETAYDFEALDYDPVTGKVYGVNDDGDQLGRGLYSFDLATGGINKIVSSPDYRRIENDFDGLATGGGKAFFTTDEAGFIYVYDFATGQFSDFLSPNLDGDLFGGAAYAPGLVPEPGVASLLLGVGAMLMRRRRSNQSSNNRQINSENSQGQLEQSMKMHNVRRTSFVTGILAIAATAATSATAQTITTIVKEGDVIPGIGTVTGVDGYAVNNSGASVVDADTDNADTNADRVLLRSGSFYWRENSPLGGLNISSWDDINLTNNNDVAGNLFLRPTGVGDSGVHYNQTLTVQEGAISAAPQFSANTPYVGWFGTKTNDNQQILSMSSMDDPNIATTVDRALVIWNVSAGGALISENAFVKEGDVLPGSALTVADLETDSNEFDFAHNGHVIYGADLTGTTLDSGVYRWDGVTNSNIAIEGGASPAAGRTWTNLASAKVSISGNGAHYAHTGTLSGDTATDSVIIRDGAVFKQEGDQVTTASGTWAITTFGTVGAFVDDSGNMVWYGDWNDPVTTQDTGIFYNNTLLVQEGVTQIDGLTVVTVRAFADTLTFSDNGAFILFEAELTGGIEGAFLIAVPEPASATALLGLGAIALRRRVRRGR